MSQYKILGKLGSGGMGVVYQALDTRLHRTVAIKVFHENLVQEEIVIKRFLRESMISAQLDHPHIVKVYNFEKQGDQSFLVMECIQGKPLLEYIEEQQPSLEIKLEILEKISRALHYAHRKKILHRDIKPANIMVRTNGEPVLMDFGLAKCVGLEDLTRTGEFVGTAHYMSPEQAEGKRREIDHRTDIYSLGAVMYYLLVEKVPIEALTLNDMLYKIKYEEPIPPRQIHPELASALEQICLKALAKAKEQRYASAQEFADDIKNYLLGKKTKAVSWSKKQIVRRWLLRSSLVLGILLLLGTLAFGGYFYAQQQQIAQKKALLSQKIQLLQSQIENQKIWRIDQPDLWQEAYQNGQEAWDLYQQNREWIESPELAILLANNRTQCAYNLGIHRWIEDPLQSTNAFASALDISLSEQQKTGKTQLAVLAADMHLKYLSHNYDQVCEIFPTFIILSAPYFKTQHDLFGAYPEVLFLVAKSHYHCQQYENALKYLQVLTLHKNFMAHKKIKAEVLYYQGMCHYHKEQYNDAMQALQAASQAWEEFGRPADFGISLLIHLGDCQSHLLPYSEPLSYQQQQVFQQILHKIEQGLHQLPQRSVERALYYELKARYLLTPNNDHAPDQDTTEQALEMIAKSYQIVPCRYTQHLLRGIAFRYQGKTNFNKYYDAYQEFNNASQLNPNQVDSVFFTIHLSTEYLNYSRDQISDLIMQVQRWNTRMEIVATDFYGPKMKQLELQCNGELQKFVGIPYQEALVIKFYHDLQSPVASIRQLAKSSLIDLVSYQDGLATHILTASYLEQKLRHIDSQHPLHNTLSSILEEIDAQAWKEAAWQHLYLLVRMPYRGRIPDLLLAECNTRSGMIRFLIQMLQDHDGQIMPELKSSWHWLQYLAIRVLVQLPYPLDSKSLAALSKTHNSQQVYARQLLYQMITTPDQNSSLSPIFCLSVAKALQDIRFLWWDRTLILQWFNNVWPQLQHQKDTTDIWRQTNIVSLLVSRTDQQARHLLEIMYQNTKYNLLKAFIINALPKREKDFLPELIVKDFYQWIPKSQAESSEITQLRILNILNASTIRSYISHKYEFQPNAQQEEKKEYRHLITQLSALLQNQEEDIKTHKAVITVMLIVSEWTEIWTEVNQNNKSIELTMSKLLNSLDQESRLLAIAAVPLIGNATSLESLIKKALDPKQPFIEKLALVYGICISPSQNSHDKTYQNQFKTMLQFLSQLQDPHIKGWISAMLCHFQYYIEDTIEDAPLRSFLMAFISSNLMQNLNSSERDLLFWALVSTTRLDDFSPTIYNKISTLFKEKQFPSPMLEVLALGVLIHLSMKYNLANDYQQWVTLGYEKLKNPQFRPYLSVLVWSYLQTMRNNAVNFQLHADVIAREEPIAIQDLHWLRYKKSLLDPQLHHYAEICLSSSLQLFTQFTHNLTIFEKEQLQHIEIMLAELYYSDGKTKQANQILENNNNHIEQIPIAMLWAEHNPQRIHEIWPTWNAKNKQYAQATQQSNIFHAAMFLRMTAIQHQQEKQWNQAIRDLEEAALLEPGEAKSWVLLLEAITNKQPEQGIQMFAELSSAGFYQARIYWSNIQYSAQYKKSEARYTSIAVLLKDITESCEYPVTLPMLKDLKCQNIPSGVICYLFALNHAKNRWHYEACYWLKETAKYDYQLTPEQIQQDFPIFKKYKTKKYKGYDVQPAIKKLFESK